MFALGESAFGHTVCAYAFISNGLATYGAPMVVSLTQMLGMLSEEHKIKVFNFINLDPSLKDALHLAVTSNPESNLSFTLVPINTVLHQYQQPVVLKTRLMMKDFSQKVVAYTDLVWF